MKNAFYFYFLVMLIFSCKSNVKKDEYIPINSKEISVNVQNCSIPENILTYLNKHSSEFERTSSKDFELINYAVECPNIAIGDFNHDNQDDFALIVRDKQYRVKGYGDHKFPTLLIFENYQNSSLKPPVIIYKTGDYKDEAIKTVIYDQFEKGIYSYIQSGEFCGEEAVEIVIPEKSSFFIYWDENNGAYQYANAMDEQCNNSINDIRVEGDDLIIKNEKYSNLIVNTMSLSTSIQVKSTSEFLLIYENNGSSTKNIEKYDVVYTYDHWKVKYKELISTHKGDAGAVRNYVEGIPIENTNYEKLQNIWPQEIDSFSANPIMSIYQNQRLLAKVHYDASTVDYFINESSSEATPIKSIEYFKSGYVFEN